MNFARFVLQNHTQVLELTLEHLSGWLGSPRCWRCWSVYR